MCKSSGKIHMHNMVKIDKNGFEIVASGVSGSDRV